MCFLCFPSPAVTRSLVCSGPDAAFFFSFVILHWVALVSPLCCLVHSVLCWQIAIVCLIRTACKPAGCLGFLSGWLIFFKSLNRDNLWERVINQHLKHFIQAVVPFETWGNWKQQLWLTSVWWWENICTLCSTLWTRWAHYQQLHLAAVTDAPHLQDITRWKLNGHAYQSKMTLECKMEKQTNMGKLSRALLSFFVFNSFESPFALQFQTSDEKHYSSHRVKNKR